MTHTSGMVYNQWDAMLIEHASWAELPVDSPTRRLDAPLMFDPGERWEYGIAIDWIGLLVETISGKASAPTCRRTSSARSG